jgi:hypothetical protein
MNVATAGETSQALNVDFKYWAFISYSHRDEAWAQWLHRAFETYRIPKQLVRHSGARDGGPSADRIYPVFRDRDELSGGFDLSEKITSALFQSRFLIVICSPRSAVSRHVQQEIETFENFGRERFVLCLIVDGEPGVSASSHAASQECLPLAVRTRRTPSGELVACEPIAADVRQGKDGRTNAKLKLLAEMLDVRFDDLKQRETRRRLKRRFQIAAAIAGACIAVAAVYLLTLDAGVAAPGGGTVRRFADRHQLSLLRRVPPDAAVQQKAGELRRQLSKHIEAARGGDKFYTGISRETFNIWTHSQIAFAVLSVPDAEAQEVRAIVPLLSTPFSSDTKIEREGVKYGWPAEKGAISAIAPPAFWTAMSLAVALRKDGFPSGDAQAQASEHLAYVENVLNRYHPDGSAGWNLFPDQVDPTQHDVYAATLALMTLLEVKRARLPWEGTAERRDRLIRQTFDWLTARFNPQAQPPGWGSGNLSISGAWEGLTLQIYGRLLDAQSEIGVTIPNEIAAQIPRHLAGIPERQKEFANDGGEYAVEIKRFGEELKVQEHIYFLSYPWAIDCAARWLRSEYARRAPPEDRLAVERTLAHLVITRGDDVMAKVLDAGTFYAAEALYGLSSVMPANSPRN